MKAAPTILAHDEEGITIDYDGASYFYGEESNHLAALAGIVITSPPFPLAETNRGETPSGTPLTTRQIGTSNPAVWAAVLGWLLNQAGLTDRPPQAPSELDAIDLVAAILEDHGMDLEEMVKGL